MNRPDADYLTERQRKWFASLAKGLERDTGRSLAEWVKIAETCPETGHRARLRWLKLTHGLAQNRASLVLAQGVGEGDRMGWSHGEALRAALWSNPQSLAILDAVVSLITPLEGVTTGQRKGFTAWSRKVQFAALRPLSGGAALLGLALPLHSAPGFEAAGKEAWSERLKVRRRLDAPSAADAAVGRLLQAAWACS